MRIKVHWQEKYPNSTKYCKKKWENQSLVSKKYQKYIVENSSTSSCRSFFGLRASCSSAQVAVLYTTSSASSSTSKYVEESEDWGGPPPPPGAERAWAGARAEAARASWASHWGPRRSEGPPPRPPWCGQRPHPPGSASGAGSPPHLRIKKSNSVKKCEYVMVLS